MATYVRHAEFISGTGTDLSRAKKAWNVPASNSLAFTYAKATGNSVDNLSYAFSFVFGRILQKFFNVMDVSKDTIQREVSEGIWIKQAKPDMN